jgi:glycosyltransferase involved in cell wall biosynthesis
MSKSSQLKRSSFPSLSRKASRETQGDNAPSARKKILIIAHNHPDFFAGGGEIAAYRMFLELKKSDAYIPTFLGATGKISREPHAGTPFLSHEGREDEYLFWCGSFDYFQQSLRDSVLLYRDFARFLEERKPDIIHFHHTLRIGIEALKVARDVLPDAKIIYTLHDFIPMCYRDGQMVRKTDESLCDKATPARCHECFPDVSSARFKAREMFIKTHFNVVDMFVSPSHFLAERFIAWGIPEHKIKVIDNGFPTVNTSTPIRSQPTPRLERYHRFGFFGQISPYKGTMLIMDAAQQLLESGITDFQVHIHGNIGLQTDAYKEEFQERLKECGSHVQFHGVYQQSDLGKIMREVDWVVMPSIWWENAPLVIAEAQHYGRPVICSDIGGMAEKVQHEVNGLHFRARSSQHLKDMMERAILEKGLWEKLISGITPPLTIAESVKRYTQYYESSTPVIR